MQVVGLPEPATVSALFEDATTAAERIERLVGEVFAIYERGAPALRAIRRESDVHPRVAEDRDAIEASLGAVVDEALKPLDVTREHRAVVRAMVDLDTWGALRDQGIGPAESIAVVAEMVASWLTPARRGAGAPHRSSP